MCIRTPKVSPPEKVYTFLIFLIYKLIQLLHSLRSVTFLKFKNLVCPVKFARLKVIMSYGIPISETNFDVGSLQSDPLALSWRRSRVKWFFYLWFTWLKFRPWIVQNVNSVLFWFCDADRFSYYTILLLVVVLPLFFLFVLLIVGLPAFGCVYLLLNNHNKLYNVMTEMRFFQFPTISGRGENASSIFYRFKTLTFNEVLNSKRKLAIYVYILL